MGLRHVLPATDPWVACDRHAGSDLPCLCMASILLTKWPRWKKS